MYYNSFILLVAPTCISIVICLLLLFTRLFLFRLFKFDKWVDKRGLSETTVNKLREEKLVTYRALRNIKEQDARELTKTIGQRILLQDASQGLSVSIYCPEKIR